VIRAVVDPGVLVSAFIGRRGSVGDRIVRAWRSGKVELIVSQLLLDELSGVLARPKFARAARDGRAVDFVGALRAGATMVEDPPGEEDITRDPKDDYLVRIARSSHERAGLGRSRPARSWPRRRCGRRAPTVRRRSGIAETPAPGEFRCSPGAKVAGPVSGARLSKG
jgi:putative PIN family toxin of toxin-antitoxin system